MTSLKKSQSMKVNEPTLGEVKQAIQRLNNGKAPGTNSIAAALLKPNIKFSATKIHQLLGNVLTFEKIPKPLEARAKYQVAEKRKSQRMQNSRGIT